MPAVSIIVPLHNSKKYLQECIGSILAQTLRDIEIICIDSSSDGTTEMLYEYQKKDSRIHVIEDSNGSYGHKLNVGIQAAAGEYIAIVESDDYIAEDMLEKMYEITHAHKLDLIKSNFEGFIDTAEGRKTCFCGRGAAMIYDRAISLRQESQIMPLVGISIWTGLYRTQFLREKGICVHESEGASYQDSGFFVLTTLLADGAYFVKDAFYKYRMDNESSSVKSDKKYRCVVDEYAWLEKKMLELGCCNERDITFFKIMKMTSYHWNYARLSKEYRRKFVEAIASENLSDFDENIIGYSMLQKEQWVELLKGNQEAAKKFEDEETAKKRLYKSLYDIIRKSDSIVIVGAGKCGEFVLHMVDMSGFKGLLLICDNCVDKQGSEMVGSIICSVEDAVRELPEAQYIIANKKNYGTLKMQIMELGVPERCIFISTCLDGGAMFFENFIKYCKD